MVSCHSQSPGIIGNLSIYLDLVDGMVHMKAALHPTEDCNDVSLIHCALNPLHFFLRYDVLRH